jgi:hypothetical protein
MLVNSGVQYLCNLFPVTLLQHLPVTCYYSKIYLRDVFCNWKNLEDIAEQYTSGSRALPAPLAVLFPVTLLQHLPLVY